MGWKPSLGVVLLALGLAGLLVGLPSPSSAVSTVTKPMMIGVSDSGPPGVGTLAGCSVNPTTITFDGAVHLFTASPNCSITVTVPSDGPSSRYRFGSLSTTAIPTCSTGACGTANRTVYFELLNTYTAVALAQPTFVGSPVFSVVGPLAGTSQAQVCEIVTQDTDASESCMGWSNYGSEVSLPQTVRMPLTRTRWTANDTTSFTDTTGGNVHVLGYYSQVKKLVYFIPIFPGGTGYTRPDFNYTSMGGDHTYVVVRAAYLWLDQGSSWSATETLTGSGPVQRWQLSGPGSGTGTSSGTLWLRYYHQVNDTFDFQVSDASTPTGPAVRYRQFGLFVSVNVSYGGLWDWVDLSTKVTYQIFLDNSTSTERWGVLNSAFKSGPSLAFSPTYYHQFLVSLNYTTDDSTRISYSLTGPGWQVSYGIRAGYYYQFGTTFKYFLSWDGSVTDSPVWVDAGANKVGFMTAKSPSGTERWAIAGTPHLWNVTSSSSIVETGYYHQYLMTLKYTVSGGGSPSPPTVNVTSLGVVGPHAASNGTSSKAWADAGSTVSYPATITDGFSTWTTSSTSFLVVASAVLDPTYSP